MSTFDGIEPCATRNLLSDSPRSCAARPFSALVDAPRVSCCTSPTAAWCLSRCGWPGPRTGAPPGTPDDPYARVIFHLADGRQLRFRDVRKFGRIGLWEGGGLRRGTASPRAGARAVREARGPYRGGD